MSVSTLQYFREYAHHRAREGRALRGDELRALPYLRAGPLARQWAVRARSYEVFLDRVVRPMARKAGLDILDLGAGNAWLSWRLAERGHRAVALDMRDDTVDGLGAARELHADPPGVLRCVKAPFDMLPFADRSFDLAVFNASLHYAVSLRLVLTEVRRVVRPGGAIAILDSPFYMRERDGERMVAEKRSHGTALFGIRAKILLSPNFIEFLTLERLDAAARDLSWARHHVRYPLWYELRPLIARLKGRRPPSRFDVWSARVR